MKYRWYHAKQLPRLPNGKIVNFLLSSKPICAWWAHDWKKSSTTGIFGTTHFCCCHTLPLDCVTRVTKRECKLRLTTSSPIRLGLLLYKYVCLSTKNMSSSTHVGRVAQTTKLYGSSELLSMKMEAKQRLMSLLGCPNWHRTGRCSRAPIRQGLSGWPTRHWSYTVKEKDHEDVRERMIW